jgi:hypothetical protein
VGLTVYGSKGQSEAQRVQDEQACYDWAKQQTGIDPTTVSVNADSAGKAAKAQADSATGGAGVKGAAKGAAAGAVVGAIAGDAGTGAAVGAAAGGVKGRRAAKNAEAQAEKQGQQQAVAQGQATMGTFSKTMATCLQGRGYAVN